jgi:trehalose 6-phosphate synthase
LPRRRNWPDLPEGETLKPSQKRASSKGKLVLISNRLPISIVRNDGKWTAVPSSGGLVTALGPVLRNRGGLWVGWPGAARTPGLKRLVEAEQKNIGFELSPVMLTQEEQDKFYFGFSNEIVWPLFHGLQSLCNYDPDYWTAYHRVNHKFAENITGHIGRGDYIWVNDYHLMNVGEALRKLGVKAPTGFFLHIPFPPLDIFQKLPWRLQVLNGLLEYDLIGFQTVRHKRNFLQAIRAMVKDVAIYGKGPVNRIHLGGREVRVGNFPIGIDYRSFASSSATQGVRVRAENLHAAFPGCKKVLGIDRLDYTKGLPYKLEGFRRALLRYPELRKKVTLLQVVVPSREDIPEYHDLKAHIERLVGEINGQLAEPGWLPIQYLFRSLSREELLAFYRASEIALITPLEDGMNLVAKEYCAASGNESSVLILSEFAGAAAQLRVGALTVNPCDLEGLAESIHQAYSMEPEEQRFRMRKMQRVLRENDIFRWVDSFLQAGIASELENYPTLREGSDQQVDDAWWWESV